MLYILHNGITKSFGIEQGGIPPSPTIIEIPLGKDDDSKKNKRRKRNVIVGTEIVNEADEDTGKSKAMEMCLTGRMMDAEEAERSGLVSRVVPTDDLLEDALKTADGIAEKSQPVAAMTKEAVNRVYETTLSEGIRFERRVFHSLFATEDQAEGMAAFIDKREPNFKNR